MKALIKPRALMPGQTVGLIATSSRLPEPERLPLAVARLEALGFRVRVAESCTAGHGYLAGDDALRAECMNQMFEDDSVDAILCVRGGYGATRILPHLRYDMIRSNPKVFSGYSDVTAIHSALQQHAGLVTFHGLMAVPDFGAEDVDAYSVEHFFSAVSCGSPAQLDNPVDAPRTMISPGCVQGRLVGGNLSLVTSCLGTPYAFDFRDAIVCLEDVGERSYAIDRMLVQLRNSGAFDVCAGVALGGFTRCEAKEGSRDLRLCEIFTEILGDIGKPVLSGVQFGHITQKLTLPLGVCCRLDADNGTISMLECAVM